MIELILASKSKVRKEIFDKNDILVQVQPSTVDEEPIKQSLLRESASPEIISKNLAEIKAVRVSQKNYDKFCLGINENCIIPDKALKALNLVLLNLENAFSNAGFVLPYNESEDTGIE